MAYPSRTRDPLLDSGTQAALSRRSREGVGVALLGVTVALILMLGSYVPDDPNWLAATEAKPQNLLGRFGASMAAPLILVLGLASWAIAVCTGVWGLRFLLHIGSERALSRSIFMPVWVAFAAIFASTHAPGAAWEQSFGLGGLFGDTILAALLGILPISAMLGLKLLSLTLLVVVAASGAFVLGCDRPEINRFGRFILSGLGTSAAGAKVLGLSASRGALRAADAYRARRDAKAAQSQSAPFAAQRSAPLTAPSATRTPLLKRVPIIGGRTPEPELVERDPLQYDDFDAPSEDRVKARIASAIHGRMQRGEPVAPPVAEADARYAHIHAEEPPLSRAEPVVTRAAQSAAPVHEDTYDRDEVVDDDAFDVPTAPMPTGTPPTGTPIVPSMQPGTVINRKVVQHPPKKAAIPSKRAMAEAQPSLALEDPIAPTTAYEPPPLSLLTSPSTIERAVLSDDALEENARMLEVVLDDYGVKGEIVSVRPGPVVTMYELEPAPGLKASRVIGLADDIARSMSALSARVSTVPGRSVIGIELPNDTREKVVLREILSGKDFGDTSMKLPLALGKDIGGAPIVANLAKMPHLLIAGTTGSGKSVAINTMILSLLYRLPPEDCRMIMIDPKMLELSVYDGIPHLLSPVVTDPKKAVVALKWVVGEMEDRYRKMSKMGVRNIEGYNSRVEDTLKRGEMFSRTVQTGFDDETGDPVFETEEITPVKLPFIVVIVDEMADLMMVAGKEIEACIQRLAQMARASGIHLIMATQRPSVDVITGTIKANFPTRISFHVTSKIDSRTILGEQGAEQLLGMGDMLYMAGGSKITRVHGPFCSDEEVEEIVNYLKSFGPPDYAASVLDGPDDEKSSDIDAVLGLGGNTDGEDALYDQAVAIVAKDRKCSTSYIQRKLAIGYNKAARLVEQMEDNGIVTPANHVGKRDILLPEQ
jgi:S-DNA-T family DNA segregation ATPase FtsK/SpoIIIE